jgi:hypothetical protein
MNVTFCKTFPSVKVIKHKNTHLTLCETKFCEVYVVCCYVLWQHYALILVVLEDNSKELIRENKLPPPPPHHHLFIPSCLGSI